MKKSLAFLMAAAMMTSMPLAVCATSGQTTLTTVVPEASYTLNVPANFTIEYGATMVEIGDVTITNADGFSPYKGLKLTRKAFDHLRCDDVDTHIEFGIYDNHGDTTMSGSNREHGIQLSGNDEGGLTPIEGLVGEKIYFKLSDESQWAKAKTGTYTTTLEFTTEVVYLENE